MHSTNVNIADKQFVVAGFGDVGKRTAERARGIGVYVIVTETDPVRALGT